MGGSGLTSLALPQGSAWTGRAGAPVRDQWQAAPSSIITDNPDMDHKTTFSKVREYSLSFPPCPAGFPFKWGERVS